MEIVVKILLGLTSLVGLAFIIERAWVLRWTQVVPSEIVTALGECRSKADVAKLRGTCEARPSPLGRLILIAADHLDWPKVDSVEALETAAGTKLCGWNAIWWCWKSSLASRRCWGWWERSPA